MKTRFSLPYEDLENIYVRVKAFWPSKKRILIAGGTGFFGHWFLESVAYIERQGNYGNHFSIISRKSKDSCTFNFPVLNESFFEVLQIDLCKKFSFENHFDLVIHAASEVTLAKESKKSDSQKIVLMTENILNALGEVGHPQKLLYISSGAVYGWESQGSTEYGLLRDSVSQDVGSYADGKIQSELLVKAFFDNSHGSYCVARCFSFVGPYGNNTMAVMEMLQAAASNTHIEVRSPYVTRSYMYPTDLMVALYKLLVLNNKSNIYNVGSEEALTLGAVAQKISDLTSSKIISLGNSNEASLAGKIYYPNMTRFDLEYGNSLTVKIDEALQRSLNFIKNEVSR